MSSSSSAPPRHLRILLDSPSGVRRLSIQASSLAELKAALLHTQHEEKEGECRPLEEKELELYDPLHEAFIPLSSSSAFASLPSTARLRWKLLPPTTRNTTHPPTTPLALPWRRFPLDLEEEGKRETIHPPTAHPPTHPSTHPTGFPVLDKRLVVKGIANSGLGTGLTTWDGAVVLAKYLEKQAHLVQGKHVLETGAGTGGWVGGWVGGVVGEWIGWMYGSLSTHSFRPPLAVSLYPPTHLLYRVGWIGVWGARSCFCHSE